MSAEDQEAIRQHAIAALNLTQKAKQLAAAPDIRLDSAGPDRSGELSQIAKVQVIARPSGFPKVFNQARFRPTLACTEPPAEFNLPVSGRPTLLAFIGKSYVGDRLHAST